MSSEQLSDGSVETARYTHGHSAAVLSAHSRRGAADSAAYLLAHLRTGMDLLDVGCGPASITADLAERVAPGRVVALDAHQVLQHLADPVGALAEMRRVTRPGGIVAVRDAVYSAMTWFPEPAGMEQWRSVYMATARANGGEPDAGSRLLSWARAAGFTDVTTPRPPTGPGSRRPARSGA